MRALYGLYSHPDSAQRAVDALRVAGVPDRQIVVISSEPFEEYEFSHRDKATWLYKIACLGGATGLAAGYWLTSTTQQAWPLATGGMPIVAMWPNLIVMFELTMLGGMLATAVTLFVTAKLPSPKPALYDPEVSDGKILVGVEEPPGSVIDAVKQVFEGAGLREKKK
ncbi:MAG: DUF3341 domain-containing protein [Acidobacteria bacterium]|nr:DUF3341 domain-containing protein [Acidobacteriota bacterium]MBI3261791.1 DUF3341 domain-containing protein [Acidobacteriota bacterium]